MPPWSSVVEDLCERTLALRGRGGEAVVTAAGRHGGADPLRQRAHPPERERGHRCAVRLTVALAGRVARSSTRGPTTPAWPRWWTGRWRRRRCAPPTPTSPGSRPSAPVAPTSTTGTTPPPPPPPTSGPRSWPASWRRARAGARLPATARRRHRSGHWRRPRGNGPPPGRRWPRSTASTVSPPTTAPATASRRRRPVAASSLDGAASGRTPRRRPGQASDPVELAPGRYEVVLEPRAVAAVLLFPAYLGFNGKAHADGHVVRPPGRPAVGREHRHLGRRHRPPRPGRPVRRRGHAQAPRRPGAVGRVGRARPRPALGRAGRGRAHGPLGRVRGVRRLSRPTCSSAPVTAPPTTWWPRSSGACS